MILDPSSTLVFVPQPLRALLPPSLVPVSTKSLGPPCPSHPSLWVHPAPPTPTSDSALSFPPQPQTFSRVRLNALLRPADFHFNFLLRRPHHVHFHTGSTSHVLQHMISGRCSVQEGTGFQEFLDKAAKTWDT